MASGTRGWRASLAAASAFFVATPSWPQTYTVASVSNVQIGTVAAAATGVTVFIGDGRSVTTSGNGAYISGMRSSSVVAITCADGSGAANSCANNAAHIVITRPGVNTGRAQGITLIETSVCCYTGTVVADDSGNLDFTWNPWSSAGTLQFGLNARFAILGDDSSLATTASSQFGVAVAKNPTVPTQFTYATVTATVQRALTLGKLYDLRFGKMVAPTTGTDDISVDYFSYRQVNYGGPNGGTTILLPGDYGAGKVVARGEPGATFSVYMQPTFYLAGPGAAMRATTNSSYNGTQTLPATGSMSLYIASDLFVPAGQQDGLYSGSFVVTVNYN